MGRPFKQEAEINTLARDDTIYWCGLIRANSGLSDAQVEAKLGKVDPNGLSFNRWRRGERSMSHDALVTLVASARKARLLPATKSFGSHHMAAFEARVSPKLKNNATTSLLSRLEAVRELHAARDVLDAAALEFQVAAAAAQSHGVEIFNLFPQLTTEKENGEPVLPEECKVNKISERVKEIASWYFFEGIAHLLVK